MAASNRKRTVKKGKNSRGATSRQETAGFQTEIILFVILAACVILLVSNFGMGGFVGDAISHFCFGLMGMMAYLFPVIFFVGAAFILINKSNRLAYKKMAAVFVMFLFMCATAQLLTDGYMSGTTLIDYFNFLLRARWWRTVTFFKVLSTFFFHLVQDFFLVFCQD